MTHTAPVRPRLRTRLIAWYAGTLCGVLLLTAAAVRFGMTRTLDQAHRESTEASVALFRQFFRLEIAEYQTVEATLAHMAGELVFEDRVIDVHRPDGSLFVVSGVNATEFYPSLRPPVRVTEAPLDPELAPGWTVEVHASIATLTAAQRRMDLWMAGGIPFMVALGALMGWWLAGRALRPIGRMASEAHALDVAAGARLTLDDPTDELGRFGASFNAVLGRLDDVLAQQRRFLADAAHELRTPIARLRSRTELGRLALAAAPVADARTLGDSTLQAVEQELRAASDMIGDLLALARADAGATALSLTDGFLDDVLADELPRWRETAEAAGIRVELGAFDEVPARFDAALARHLLGLLLDNAIHYAPSGSTVTVHLGTVASDVHLIVEDQGIGIPPSAREAVFERFHRTPEARAHRADGSGLGLALARWIVERHGGVIRATDRTDGGPGARLVAMWPLRPAIPVASTPPASSGRPAARTDATAPDEAAPRP